MSHYNVLTELYRAPRLRARFNLEARLQAGFNALELAQRGQAVKFEFH